jgi:hypothetical protein
MILLLSTASNLYWLGRYMIRIDGLCRVLPFKDDQEASRFAQAMSLPAWDAATLNSVLSDPLQPSSINANLHAVRDNMQAVRGVISQELFEVMNLLSSPNTINKQYICELIAESSEVMADEEDTIRLFWQLGECIEQIDVALRLKRSADLAIKDLRMVVEMLSPIGWQRLEQPWVELQYKKDIIALYSFCDHMQSLFEDGP